MTPIETASIDLAATSEGRVVFISGASSGLGEATAKEFATAGFKVAISGRDGHKLEGVIDNLRNSLRNNGISDVDDRFLALEADFEDLEQVNTLVDRVVAKFKRLDVLINNADYLGQSCDLMHENFFDDFQNVLQVNLMAATRLSQLAAPYLIESPRGVLLNMSFALDKVASPNLSYYVSKAGLSMLTKTLANELEGTRVRVVAVAPAPMTTSIPPLMETLAGTIALGQMGRVEEVANLIKFLESEKASFVHGSTIDIDGAFLARLATAADPYTPKKGVSIELN